MEEDSFTRLTDDSEESFDLKEGEERENKACLCSNDTRLMEDLVKHSAPIRLSLMTFAKPENAGQGKGFAAASQDTDILFEEKAIQCTIHEIKLLRKIYQQIQRRVTL